MFGFRVVPDMPTRRLLCVCVLAATVAFTGHPRAQSSVAFYGVGDLPGAGGIASIVWDATKVGGTIYAVGASVVNGTTPAGSTAPNMDAPMLWTRSAGGTVNLQALLPAANSATSPSAAFAITPNAQFIASQLRTATVTAWARVNQPLLPNVSAYANLGAVSGTVPLAPLSFSDDGLTVYGQRAVSGTLIPARVQGSSGNDIDVSPTGRTSGLLIPRGASSDGMVAVGMASNGNAALVTLLDGSLGMNTTAFRYAHTIGTSVIPKLDQNGWNVPLAISSDGQTTVVAGNTPDGYPLGAVYLTNAANVITATLGSPNTALVPRAPGGMTADGVIGVTFSSSAAFGPSMQFPSVAVPAGLKHAYFRNQHGWFPLPSILAANGIDLAAMGWDPTNLAITGMRTVAGVDLVFGQGRRRTVGSTANGVNYITGAVEGFVAELPVGALAAFNPQPTPPENMSLVGAWVFDTLNPDAVITHLADGRYIRITATGYERGLSTLANDGAFMSTTLVDTEGTTGYSSRNGHLGMRQFVTGDIWQPVDSYCTGCTPFIPNFRVVGAPNTIRGAWVGEHPDFPGETLMAVATSDKLLLLFGGREVTSYTWDPVTYALFENGEHAAVVTPSADGLSLHTLSGDGFEVTLHRVIDPATIPVILNPSLSATGTVGVPFNFDVNASNTLTFTATGLPPGLSINSSTGEITGTPGFGGQFAVTLKAMSSIGVSDIETLTLTIQIPTPVGENVVVQPQVPEGQGPVTITFGEINTAGATTVTVLDPSEVPAPGNVGIGGVVYEVTTTAAYEGLITLCFSYAGIDFGTASPRLFHYENNVWVDITTSIEPATQTICGATTSLSPFAVFVSNVVRTGFYAPVNPIAGFLNTVKGGSTVPLKFNVAINGVNQTSTTGMELTVQSIHCDSSAPQNEVDTADVTGGASLRYDAGAGYFIQNWKVPKAAGCYMVRVTTVQDGLALTARFKVR